MGDRRTYRPSGSLHFGVERPSASGELSPKSHEITRNRSMETGLDIKHARAAYPGGAFRELRLCSPGVSWCGLDVTTVTTIGCLKKAMTRD